MVAHRPVCTSWNASMEITTITASTSSSRRPIGTYGILRSIRRATTSLPPVVAPRANTSPMPAPIIRPPKMLTRMRSPVSCAIYCGIKPAFFSSRSIISEDSTVTIAVRTVN